MIEYSILDKDGNEFELNGVSIPALERNSLTMTNEVTQNNIEAEDNSFLPGKIKIGATRIESTTLSFKFNFATVSDSAFNNFVNNLYYELAKSVYLHDTTNSKRIQVAFDNASIANDVGSIKRSGVVTFMFLCLEPYWEDLIVQELNTTTVADVEKELIFSNTGFLPLFPIFHITAPSICESVEFVMDFESIIIEDPIFGSTDNELMTVDNQGGFVSINNMDRTKYISDGLGFISVPVNNATKVLKILTSKNCTILIEYRRRYYV